MSQHTPLDPTLLHDYQKWRSEPGNADLKLWDYINCRGDFELAVAFSKLFWPDFVEVDGCVLLSEQYNAEKLIEWREKFGGDRQKIESMINHIHVYDLFLNGAEAHPTVYEYLGQVLLKCWSAALRQAFPDKRFKFNYGVEPAEYGPTLTFFQEKA